jgi:hypothetical protein
MKRFFKEDLNMERKHVESKELEALSDDMFDDEIGLEDAIEDQKFAEKVRTLKRNLTKLTPKKNKKLRNYGVPMIRPNTTVEELVDIVNRIALS